MPKKMYDVENEETQEVQEKEGSKRDKKKEERPVRQRHALSGRR